MMPEWPVFHGNTTVQQSIQLSANKFFISCHVLTKRKFYLSVELGLLSHSTKTKTNCPSPFFQYKHIINTTCRKHKLCLLTVTAGKVPDANCHKTRSTGD